MNPSASSWRLTYEISPIFLTSGIVGNLPGAMTPLIAYTEGNSFGSILGGGSEQELDNYFAHFSQVPGSTMISNAIGQYPFANISVAANAIIFEPLTVSLIMLCPARSAGGYVERQAILTSLKRTLDSHNLAGGTYSIATPNFLYTDCVMVRMVDASIGETRQPQYRYQLDFIQPLVSEEGAKQSYNNLMAKIGGQTQLQAADANWSNVPNSVGNPASGASPSIIPTTKTDPGQGFAPTGDLTTGSALISGFGSTALSAVAQPSESFTPGTLDVTPSDLNINPL